MTHIEIKPAQAGFLNVTEISNYFAKRSRMTQAHSRYRQWPSTLAWRSVTVIFLLFYPVAQGYGQDAFSALPQTVKAPPDNPPSADKAALGKLLFWDPILSGAKDVA